MAAGGVNESRRRFGHNIAFFGAGYLALAEDGVGYGYFQFRLMRDAVRDRDRLRLDDMATAAT